MTTRAIRRYVGSTLGPVVPDEIFVGSLCPLIARQLSFVRDQIGVAKTFPL